ncbi:MULTISPECIES: GerMN domain-containing protein [unclassified Pseudobutyrivibrio]|uniref:GerMN domain-containing protein n=1 Tax=unclassified Pseudobutyrivibrio TaxID=2638619 RepID=UPI0006785735|nr:MULTISPECIES: GerMN domain-containing protein [unclassified Pseudobutyrivibrio]SFO29722.1 germination protein M [Pseudobutyrivibrio sp. JW11]
MKRLLSLILTITLALSMVSCGSKNEESDYQIYYLKSDKAGIVPTAYTFQSDDTAEMVEEAINELAESPDDIDYINTIPSEVEAKSWEINDGNLSLYLVGGYDSLDTYTEILVRAAIVKTLVQIDGVESVSIYVNDAPLADSNGDSIGAMTADTFIEDFGQETDSLLSTNLTLYFASADGMSTVAETREVYYSRNVTIERLVIEQLLKGPDSDELLSAIPPGTKLNSISVSENGVCIVNFDAAIESTVTGVTENVTVYSIVNSLTELDNIKQVQILVNGDTPHISNVDVDLSSSISRNEDIINELADQEEEDEELYLEDDSDFDYTETEE